MLLAEAGADLFRLTSSGLCRLDTEAYNLRDADVLWACRAVAGFFAVFLQLNLGRIFAGFRRRDSGEQQMGLKDQ
jgi:hypothetical protein